MRIFAIAVPAFCMFAGVAAANPPAAPATRATPVAATQPSAPKAAGGKPGAKHLGSEYFHVNVSLSSQILGFLQQRKETVVVSAEYYGWPAQGAEQQADEMGEVQLGEEEVEKPNPGKAVFTGAPINKRKLKDVKDGAVQVLINVYSGRHSSPDNLLSCGFFEGSIDAVRKYDLTLTCKLLDDAG
ncbi:MAG TPA: hypothetical protein VLG68_01500 [Gammaproteobacteria bacterium]|nr:hypothetical protein [Gammaproteobacteria bacterium]